MGDVNTGHSTTDVTQNLVAPEIHWNWEQANYVADWHEPIVRLISRYVPRKAKVLEVGAGGSHTLGALAARLECETYGVEPDLGGIKKTIELAKAESGKVRMILGDGFNLPFDEGAFDVVYSLGLVEHFEPKQTQALIEDHLRVCKPAGIVIVAVPNLLNLPHTLRKAYLGSRYEYAPERSFSPREIKRILASAGVESITVDGVNPLWGLGMSSLGWRIVDLLRRVGIAKLIDDVKSPSLRANIGYMSYAIGRKAK